MVIQAKARQEFIEFVEGVTIEIDVTPAWWNYQTNDPHYYQIAYNAVLDGSNEIVSLSVGVHRIVASTSLRGDWTAVSIRQIRESLLSILNELPVFAERCK